jgi:hypothetical protein
MNDTEGHMLRKIHDKIFGNGVPGMDQKIDKQYRMIEALAKDNSNDHALILKKMCMNEKEIKEVKARLAKHLKTSKFGNKIRAAGKTANDFVFWTKSFATNIKETLIIIVTIVAIVLGIFHKDVGMGVKKYKAWKAKAIAEEGINK